MPRESLDAPEDLLKEGSASSRVASGQIKLRRIDGWRKIAAVLSQHMAVTA